MTAHRYEIRFRAIASSVLSLSADRHNGDVTSYPCIFAKGMMVCVDQGRRADCVYGMP